MLADTIPVTLSAVYFEDYLTGSLTDITTTWAASTCATQAFAAGAAGNPSCSFSSTATATALQSFPALCQGFVKAVYYTVSHETTTAATISAVTATVTLSDVPMPEDEASVVTVTQTFGTRFSSSDATQQSSDNGNLVKR